MSVNGTIAMLKILDTDLFILYLYSEFAYRSLVKEILHGKH